MNTEILSQNLATVKSLQPRLLWDWFATISSIPHPSYHEEILATYIVDWARGRGLSAVRDDVGNVIIKKPATVGMENRTPMALQAHLDMVPQANADVLHDFSKDPILLRFTDDSNWLKATDTTLGADNGIGMASCLAVLESDLPHPELEVLLTMTEETGMVGAVGLQAGWLTAPIMINTDTEEIGEIYVGCAGGMDADLTLPLQYIDNQHDTAFQIVIKGLKGGHSGIDIHKNRGNAIKLLGQLLQRLLQTCQFGLADIKGGSLRNAIARESGAIIHLNSADKEKVIARLEAVINDLMTEFGLAEPNLVITYQETTPFEQSIVNTAQVINLINALPSGVVRYSDNLPDVVETSLSFGVLAIQEGRLLATLLVRSLTEIGKTGVQSILDSIATLAGANASFGGSYVGWNYDPTSVITPITKELYAQILGREPDIKVIHAGLECGLIKTNYPNMDIVSIGPTIKNAHSPDEMVDVASVAIYWQLLTQLLANSPVKA